MWCCVYKIFSYVHPLVFPLSLLSLLVHISGGRRVAVALKKGNQNILFFKLYSYEREELINPAYTFPWNCWTLTSLADKKCNTRVEESFTCFLSSVSSSLFPGTCFSYSLPCDHIKTIISPFCRWAIQVAGWIFISSLQHKGQQSWPEEPNTLLVLGPSSSQSHTELFRMMLDVFRPHCDLQEISCSSNPESDGFGNCGVSAQEVQSREKILGRY